MTRIIKRKDFHASCQMKVLKRNSRTQSKEKDTEDKYQHHEELDEDRYKFEVVLGEPSLMLQSQILENELQPISHTLGKEDSQMFRL